MPKNLQYICTYIQLMFFEENYKVYSKCEMKLFTNQNKLKTSALEGTYAKSLIHKTHATYVFFAKAYVLFNKNLCILCYRDNH